MVIYPAGLTDHTERKRTSAKLLNAAPFCATLLGYLSGLFPLRRSGVQGRRNSRATMLLQLTRLCFRPAVVDLSSGGKTGHGEPMRPRATLAVSLWFFIRPSCVHIRRASELRNAAPRRARLLRSVPSGVFSLRRKEGRAQQSSWAAMLFRRVPRRQCRLCYFFGEFDWPYGKKTN